MILTLFDKAGAGVLKATDTFGDFAVLAGRTFAAIFKRPFDGKNLLNQFQSVGVNSIPVVALTSLAVSMVFAVQLAYGFKQFQAEGLASQVEGLAIMRELAPVITGLMLSGRVGSDTQLVAPLVIGDGALIGAGSTITKDVPADALTLSRTPQTSREGGASKLRARQKKGSGVS